MNTKSVWSIIAIWFSVSIIVFSLEKMWSIVLYAISFGVVYGGFVYKIRNRIKKGIESSRFNNFFGFIIVAVLVSIAEEVYVYALGNQIAIPNILLDIIVVPTEWAVWFAFWYLLLSQKYKFTESEALLTAGLTGILYEYVGTGFFMSNPIGFFLSIPLAVVVYSAIFVLPMQFIDFSGKKDGISKYVVSVGLPYLFTIPIALIIYFIIG